MEVAFVDTIGDGSTVLKSDTVLCFTESVRLAMADIVELAKVPFRILLMVDIFYYARFIAALPLDKTK